MNNSKLLLLLSTGIFLGGCAVQPDPITSQEIQDRVARDMEALFKGQEPHKETITLEAAVQRSLQYNLDQRVKLMEEALARGQLESGFYAMFPQMSTSGSSLHRNNDVASFSKNLRTGAITPDEDVDGLTTSQENHHKTWDASFVWNFLDFGVSYIQAKQTADELLIAEQRRRKAAQDITRDVRYAFWRAVSAQALMPEIESLLAKTEKALENSRKQEKISEPEKAMEFQDELLQRLRQLVAMRREMIQAKTQLASLMNMRPGEDFTLDTKAYGTLEVPALNLTVKQMEAIAMTSRPELLEEDYQERIGKDEVNKAILRMFPGLELSATRNYDDNKFNFEPSWTDQSVKLIWNITQLITGPTAVRQAQAQRDLAIARRMAMLMAVLTQVNVSNDRYLMNLKDFQLADEYLRLRERRSKRAEAAQSAQGGEQIEVIRQESAKLVAKLQRDMAYAELQNAFGMAISSLGKNTLDPLMALSSVSQDPEDQGTRVSEMDPASIKPVATTKSSKKTSSSEASSGLSAGEEAPAKAPVVQDVPGDGAALKKGQTFNLQVASFPSEDEAQTFAKGLLKDGLPARVGASDSWYWVRLGPYPSRKAAESMAKLWRERTQFQALIL